MDIFEQLEDLYMWVDAIPLSKCSRNVTRDFSDGVLMAELCKYFFPKIVDLHNYPPANSQAAKVRNWETLNIKVFSKLHIKVTLDLIHQIASGVPGALESVLLAVKKKVEEHPRPGDSGDRANMVANSVVLKEVNKLKKEVQGIHNTLASLNKKVGQIETLLEMKEDCLLALATDVEQLKMRKNESIESFNSILA